MPGFDTVVVEHGRHGVGSYGWQRYYWQGRLGTRAQGCADRTECGLREAVRGTVQRHARTAAMRIVKARV